MRVKREDGKNSTEGNKSGRVSGFAYVITGIMSGLGVLLCINQIFHLHIATFMPIGNAYYYYILGVFLSLSFLIFPARNKDKQSIPWYDWCLFII